MESASDFPLPKLRYYKYLILDVMMHVEYQYAYEFMFSLNTEARSFFCDNFITIRNEYINNGLITYDI